MKICFIQVLISVIYTQPSWGPSRGVAVGGGSEVGHVILIWFPGAYNCSLICKHFIIDQGYMDSCCTATSKSYCAKCFDAVSATPLNGMRVAFTSQVQTNQIDPLIPSTNNATQCSRIDSWISYLSIVFEKAKLEFLWKWIFHSSVSII